MATVKIDCPYCGTNNSQFEVIANPVPLEQIDLMLKPKRCNYEGVGRCSGCGSYVALFWEVNGFSVYDFVLRKSSKVINYERYEDGTSLELIGYLPTAPQETRLDHVPDNVARSFSEAERARLNQIWTAAAASYGKAIERGVAHLLPDDGKRRTLGQKIWWLAENDKLSEPLTDWARVILKDRNFATHDDDGDFESAEEIETIRSFATILLEYLHTMPARVRIARGEDHGEPS